MAVIKTLTLLILLGLIAACKYEPASENATASSQSNNSSSPDNSQNANITAEKPLIEIAKCDGECTCDEISSPYNDTGVTFAGDYPDTNLPVCNLQSANNQDCTVGRDSIENLIKKGTGEYGFDFTKLNEQGRSLPSDAQQWHCVLDNVTGLIWEVKAPKGSGTLQDAGYTYSWLNDALPEYSTANHGSCDQDCDTQSYLNRLNTLKLCGFDDWRLPSKIELQDLVHYGRSQPSIDVSFFPNTNVSFYWSSNIDTDDLNSVWNVGFSSGRVAGGPSSQKKMIRAVRGELNLFSYSDSVSEVEANAELRREYAPKQRCNDKVRFSSPVLRYLQDEQGNILDKQTGLIWKRCTAGLSGETCEQGEAQLLDWQQAFAYVAELNDQNPDANWRLPSLKELQANNELACEEPALNPFAFPNIPMGKVWSGTPHNRFDDSSYHYEYQNSIIFYSARNVKHYVHAVKNCAVKTE